jgi:hypothetical protein
MSVDGQQRLRWKGVGLVGCLLLVAACSGQGSAEDGNATTAAQTFSESVDGRTEAACSLLAPETLKELESSEGPCDTALPDQLQGSTGGTRSAEAEVYGKDAIVHLGNDTVFLARFRDGWRVTAAGCTPQEPGRPYDCKVKGS